MNATIVWTGPKGNIIENNTYMLMANTSTYEATVSILFRRNDSGDYTCSATLTHTALKQFLTYLHDSAVVASNRTRITTGMYMLALHVFASWKMSV